MTLKIIKIKGDWAEEIKHYQPNFDKFNPRNKDHVKKLQ